MSPASPTEPKAATPYAAAPTGEALTFVLVHGAWHGGWCWIRVTRLLTDATHVVYTPTLTGLGERAKAFYEANLALSVGVDRFARLFDNVIQKSPSRSPRPETVTQPRQAT